MSDQNISFLEQKAITGLERLLERHGPWYPPRYDIVQRQFEANHQYRLEEIDPLPHFDPILGEVYKQCHLEVQALLEESKPPSQGFREWSLLLNHLYGIAMLQSVANDLLVAFDGEGAGIKGALRNTDLICLDKAVKLLETPSIDWNHQHNTERKKGSNSVRSEHDSANAAAWLIRLRLTTLRGRKAPRATGRRYNIETSEIEALEKLRDIAWDRVTMTPLNYEECLLQPGDLTWEGPLPESDIDIETSFTSDGRSSGRSGVSTSRTRHSRSNSVSSTSTASRGIIKYARDKISSGKNKGKSAFEVYKKWRTRNDFVVPTESARSDSTCRLGAQSGNNGNFPDQESQKSLGDCFDKICADSNRTSTTRSNLEKSRRSSTESRISVTSGASQETIRRPTESSLSGLARVSPGSEPFPVYREPREFVP